MKKSYECLCIKTWRFRMYSGRTIPWVSSGSLSHLYLPRSITWPSCPTCTTLVFKKWCAIGRGQSALGRIWLLGGRPAPVGGQQGGMDNCGRKGPTNPSCSCDLHSLKSIARKGGVTKRWVHQEIYVPCFLSFFGLRFKLAKCNGHRAEGNR